MGNIGFFNEIDVYGDYETEFKKYFDGKNILPNIINKFSNLKTL